MRLFKAFCVNILIPIILAIIMANLGIIGCEFGGRVFLQAPCWLINFLVVGVATAFLLDFIVYYFWPNLRAGKWEKPRLELIPSADIAISDRPLHQAAQLEIVNLDQLEITECYATLAGLWYRRWIGQWDMVCGIPSLIGQPDRIKWVESMSPNALCEIKIPAKDSRHLDLADTLDGLGVNLCTGRSVFSDSEDYTDNNAAYTVRIRVDGKFNGKSMKPLRFDGYLYYEVRISKTIIKQQSLDGEFFEETQETDYPKLMFEKGDWTKSKKIRIILGVEGRRKIKPGPRRS